MSYDYRMVYTKVWRADEWFASLDLAGKLFWLWLVTNGSANASGVYQVRPEVAAVETGLTPAQVEALLVRFETDRKIRRAADVVWVIKMREYQTRGSRSPKILASIYASLRAVSDCHLKVEYANAYGDRLIDLLQNPSSVEKLLAPPPSPSPAESGATAKAAERTEDPFTYTLKYLSKKEAVNGKQFNPMGALAYLFRVRFGTTYQVNYGRLGRIANSLGNDYSALAKLIWACPLPEGDPHDFLTRAAVKNPAYRKAQPQGKAASAPQVFATSEDATDAFWQQHLTAQEHGNGSE